MPNDSDGRSAPRDVSRRHLFKQVGLAGAAAAVSAAVPTAATAQTAVEPATPGAVPKAAGYRPTPVESRVASTWTRAAPCYVGDSAT